MDLTGGVVDVREAESDVGVLGVMMKMTWVMRLS